MAASPPQRAPPYFVQPVKSRKRGIVDAEPPAEISNKKAKTTATALPTRRGGRRHQVTRGGVQEWFEELAGGKEVMGSTMAYKWLAEMGLSAEGAAYFVVAWKLGAKAMFALDKTEFVEGMKRLGYVL